MFISEAWAASTPAAMQGNGLGVTLIQVALILLIFYFFLIRPQTKRMREHAEMVNALKAGDRVSTSGGIYGTVTKVDAENNEVTLEIAPNVNIVIERMAVSGVVPSKTAKKTPSSKNAEVKSQTTKKSKKSK